MKPFSFLFILIILSVLLLIDLYVYRGIRILSSGLNQNSKNAINIAYWSVYLIIFLLSGFIYLQRESIFESKTYYNVVYPFMGLLIATLVPKLLFIVFLVLADITRIIHLIVPGIALIKTISFYTLLTGISASILLFCSFVFGIVYGRFHYQINTIEITSDKIPESFHNKRVIQISDWHIGSYTNHKKRITDIVDRVNEQQPDILLFTGDMVNNLAEELAEFTNELKRLHAPLGKYAVLGNHDYGDYVNWKSGEEKEKNLENLKSFIKKSGFTLLNNQSQLIKVDSSFINLLGTENWGLPPFPQFGDIAKATEGIDTTAFTILLSHDPTHWSEKVVNYSFIDLTLAGHTHGMQFGIDIPWLKWSPVKWKYPLWKGLYKQNSQLLYVNKGIGFIGFPGRVGMRPEIAVFSLKKEQKN